MAAGTGDLSESGAVPPFGLPYFVAHTPSKARPGHWHPLVEHAQCVADIAQRFAEPFGGGTLARYVGLLHDLGKFDAGFQQYLYDCGMGIARQAGSAPHKQAGALVAWDIHPKAGRRIAQILYGHHGGMEDECDTRDKALERQRGAKLSVDAMRQLARSVSADLDPEPPHLSALFPSPHNRREEMAEMYLRFVFSCLTDADSLDTERHMNPGRSAQRDVSSQAVPGLPELCRTLRAEQAKLIEKAEDTEVNRVRRRVYEDCLRAALLSPGVFTLTVPTGGGKTMSALAFALEHAAAHGLRRVVYAAPFTSILDQTAAVFERVFGADRRIVLEHHSAVDPEGRSKGKPEEAGEEGGEREVWRRLAAENWDAPLVVTTQVQLFESLFSNRPGKCRKLHRLAQSVLILDEVQSLPVTLLRPLIDALKILSANFGVTVVLCTATQPPLDAEMPHFAGFNPRPTEIVSDVEAHFTGLSRVQYVTHLSERREWADVAEELRTLRDGGTSCLCVVNTRRQALELTDLLDSERKDGSVFYLSTLLCGRHRRAVLDTVKARLKEQLPTILVSTTVVEAGVDVDFPRLMRALAPLPSLIQAAGRCNREGERGREESEVVIFVPAKDEIPADKVYAAARDLTRIRLEKAQASGTPFPFENPSEITQWFTDLLRDLGPLVDAKDIRKDVREYAFATVAEKMRLIEDKTVTVLPLNYDPREAQAILDEADARGGMTRDLWRRLGPLTVSVYAETAASLEERFPGLFLWPGRYDPKTGMPLLSDPAEGVAYAGDRLIV